MNAYIKAMVKKFFIVYLSLMSNHSIGMQVSLQKPSEQSNDYFIPPAIRVPKLIDLTITQVATNIAAALLGNYKSKTLAYPSKLPKQLDIYAKNFVYDLEAIELSLFKMLNNLAPRPPDEIIEKIGLVLAIHMACSKVTVSHKKSILKLMCEFLVNLRKPACLILPSQTILFTMKVARLNLGHIDERFEYDVTMTSDKYWTKITLIHLAVISGYIEAVKFLRLLNADIDSQDEDGHTPLYWCFNNFLSCTAWKNDKILYELLPYRPDSTLINVGGLSALNQSYELTNPKYALILLNLLREKNQEAPFLGSFYPPDEATQFIYAVVVCSKMHRAIAARILEKAKVAEPLALYLNGASIETALAKMSTSNKKETLLCLIPLAISSGDIDAMRIFQMLYPDDIKNYQETFNSQISDNVEIDLLKGACSLGCLEIVMILCDLGLTVHQDNFLAACVFGHHHIVNFFLNNQKLQLFLDHWSIESIEQIIEAGRDAIAAQLLQRMSINMLSKLRPNFFSYLCKSVFYNLPLTCAWLLENGAPTNAAKPEGALYMEDGFMNCNEYNFGTSADVNKFKLKKFIEEEKLNPLAIASNCGHLDLVELLLRHKANANLCCFHKRNALHRAARNGHTKIVSRLLQAGAQVDIKDAFGYTPFHLALIVGNPEVMRILLAAGAEKEEVLANYKCSPLQYACNSGYLPLVEMLLVSGAHPDTFNKLHEGFVKFSEANILRKNIANSIIELIENKKKV